MRRRLAHVASCLICLTTRISNFKTRNQIKPTCRLVRRTKDKSPAPSQPVTIAPCSRTARRIDKRMPRSNRRKNQTHAIIKKMMWSRSYRASSAPTLEARGQHWRHRRTSPRPLALLPGPPPGSAGAAPRMLHRPRSKTMSRRRPCRLHRHRLPARLCAAGCR